MEILEQVMQAMRDLRSEWKRLGLVGLGVAWGTLSLMLLVAFGDGTNAGVHQTIENFGVNLLRIGGGTRSMAHDGLTPGGRIGLQPGDEGWLQARLPQARAVALEYSWGSGRPVRYNGKQINTPLSGCGPKFLSLRSMKPEPGGRFLSEADVTRHRHVCFLGDRTARRLFGTGVAVGSEVQLLGRPFKVIGVRQDLTGFSGYNGSDRDKVMIPHTVFRDLVGWRNISFLLVGLQSSEDKDEALSSIYSVLGKRHGFAPEDRQALLIGDYIGLQDSIEGMLNHRHFNSGIGFFGLLVAILGVMNVMYAMVEERTREIGVCIALGATPSRIIRERLIESLLVTLGGGALGLIGCAGFLTILNRIPMDSEARAYLGYPSLSLGLGLAAVCILGIAGFVAGWYPARRASLLDPIEALRNE